MNISDVRIRKTMNEARLKAVVSLTIENSIAIHDIKIIQGDERLFVAMPSRRDDSGNFRDIVHPISPEAREVLEEKILSAYNGYLTSASAHSQEGLLS
ncbi:MAG: septation regulator SpoVG [Firmicutes bacterium]|nr:septation regulator SpoVG [[Eubacterium] siraeum]MCM1488334.1 septation regulator SpoVG [Bacillota bacterium]